MANINVIFNGASISTNPDQTILEFASSNGVQIPTLCHDVRMSPYGSCFLCVVNVKGAKSLIPACATKLRDGMEIETNSEKVIDSRKTALELITSNHYGDCIAPCKLACPANCDIQGYLGLVANGKYDDAIKLIKETIPFPASIGRVCPKFCEDKCNRQYVDESISIDGVKRFVADWDLSKESPYIPKVKSSLDRRVAIVGAGPGGLSLAYFLAREGVEVEVFEAKDSDGGMLRYGIPEYRLPKAVLDNEINTISILDSVTINYETVFGKDITFESLKKDGFDAIVLAMGAWKPSRLGVANENASGVLDGIKFLEAVTEKRQERLYGRVAVVGGGNTAFDCARTALRMGAEEVVMVYRRTKEEMPANDIEKHEAEEEGIKFMFLTAPVQVVVNEESEVVGLESIKMELGSPDASGRRAPIPVPGSEFVNEYDFIITAIGQAPDYSLLGEMKDELTDGKKIVINPETMQTKVPYIFAAGDYAIGAKTVVEAIGSAKKCMKAILKFFDDEAIVPSPKKEFFSKREGMGNEEGHKQFFDSFEKIKRVEVDVTAPNIRKSNFEEIEAVMSEDGAVKESSRCIECGCMDLYECSLKKHCDTYEIDENKYKGAANIYAKDDSHRYILREPSKCILCGRCARICDSIVSIGAYGYVRRGFDSIIAPDFEGSLNETDCISCGACISTCPVGALTPKQKNIKPAPIKTEEIETSCYHCSIGCLNSVSVLTDSIYEVKERPLSLCKKGRFHFSSFNRSKAADISKFDIFQFRDASVYPSPQLSAEDYEALKLVAPVMDWEIVNYYSKSSLWQAFAKAKTLPAMDFFVDVISDNALVILAGDIENINPIVINRLSKLMKDNTKIVLVNKEMTTRVRYLNGELISIENLKKYDFKKYSEVIFLINPIDFDSIYGDDASLDLYNSIVGNSNNLKTTLFSEARNLYSYYDSFEKRTKSSKRKIYIQTMQNEKDKCSNDIANFSIVFEEDGKIKTSFPLSFSVQNSGSFLNSKNEFYKNVPIFEKESLTLADFLKEMFGAKPTDLVVFKSDAKEKVLSKEGLHKLNSYPLDSFRYYHTTKAQKK